ncbi:cation diffusion facilitator family transporter [Thiorhodococcus mannitoliphagus]|uniref:Cation diffusion facilitator family transporter n=1 Tax=Thiorhodococcus mannitoliphagus TaxID=329406 RepID=A0A6P1DNA2_9GAMM|nr:cation diffusion facilitator family transporter [Thiorhodococcus mannitoliphagus]NEX19508.1 cation diffusion facilitator family transporter [Thiorhodococcus mannitoliphagus]
MSASAVADKQKIPIAVYGAMAANGVIAVAKGVAALYTGSSAMFSECIHSLVDTANEGLLLLGMKNATRKPDQAHPFGYGKELYFWSLIVAVALFGIGGGLTFFEGVTHVTGHAPEGRGNVIWNYAVIGIALIAEGISWTIALREFLPSVKDKRLWRALRAAKDPTTVTVIFEDSAALLGLLFALIGVYLTEITGNAVWDGIASMMIGVTLSSVALLLAYESRSLLIGEAADPQVTESIRQIAREDADVVEAGRPLTMHFGPDDVLLNLDVRFRSGLSSETIMGVVDRLERGIRERHPEIKRIFIEAESLRRDQDRATAQSG